MFNEIVGEADFSRKKRPACAGLARASGECWTHPKCSSGHWWTLSAGQALAGGHRADFPVKISLSDDSATGGGANSDSNDFHGFFNKKARPGTSRKGCVIRHSGENRNPACSGPRLNTCRGDDIIIGLQNYSPYLFICVHPCDPFGVGAGR